MIEAGIHFCIIMNPENGELSGNYIDLSDFEEFENLSLWQPTYIVKNNLERIKENINSHGYNNCVLILKKESTVDENSFIDYALESTINHIVVDVTRRRIVHSLKTKKQLIRLDNNFQALNTNYDYLGTDEDVYSEEFKYYKDDGYSGFSDFTVLPDSFKEGGSLPKVLVIHLTYLKNSDQIYVKHFTSYSNTEDQSNIAGKFQEAANSAINFFDSKGYKNQAIDILKNYVAIGKFPGLGMVKKASILNHLELIESII